MSELPDSAMISARILSGELPSKVLRSILAQSPDVLKNDLAHVLHEAFFETGHELVYCVWHWRAREAQAAYDAQFDIRVLRTLMRAGITLPWGEAFCAAESERIKAELATLADADRQAAYDAVSFERLEDKVRTLACKVVCIQALWDGDTRGWHITLDAVVERASGLETVWLGTAKFGGDIRLFKGGVPPWPEAVHAKEVGTRLADAFGAEFYFPSPDKPDDSLPNWLERGAAR